MRVLMWTNLFQNAYLLCVGRQQRSLMRFLVARKAVDRKGSVERMMMMISEMP